MAEKTSEKALENILAALPDDCSIDHYEHHRNTIELFVNWNEPARGERFCPSCGSGRCVKKDNGTMQTVRHLPVGALGTLVTFHKPRFLCKDCGKSFFVRPDWVMRDMSITLHVMLQIGIALTSSTKSLTGIAADTMTSPAIVLNAMNHIKLGTMTVLPETIGIDEFHGKSGTYNHKRKRYDVEPYHCVITDIDGGAVIDVLYKATFHELHDYFMQFPPHKRRAVKYFCADMRGGFSKVARSCFPHAKICIDPFHVVKLLTEAVSAVRTEQWKQIRDSHLKAAALAKAAKEAGDQTVYTQYSQQAKQLEDDYKLVKSSQRLLVTSPRNDTAYWNTHQTKRDEKLKEIFRLAPDLQFARKALMEFYALLEASEKYKRSGLTDWLASYEHCDCPPIRQAAHSISIHRQGIENAWRYGKSNGTTEGLNKKIKDCKRMGFGAHNFENFRRRILLACGPTTITTKNYTIFSEKRHSEKENRS